MEPSNDVKSFPALLVVHMAPTVDRFDTRKSDAAIKLALPLLYMGEPESFFYRQCRGGEQKPTMQELSVDRQ